MIMGRKTIRTLAGAAAVAVAVGAALIGADPVRAQESTGRITGQVTRQDTGHPIANASIRLLDTDRTVLTDRDGRFVLSSVPSGYHGIHAQMIGFSPDTVTDVRVRPGETSRVDVTLAFTAIAIDSLTVTAAVDGGSATAVLEERRRRDAVTDGIGAERIGRSPDGTAAAVLARVPGVSVVDGAYVHIRGLGTRYGQTTLNGARLPSPEPDRKAVPLDLIPAGILESVVATKSYTPDQPGDYAGGLVQIRTRDIPDARLFTLGASSTYDTEASFRPGLGYDGGRLDPLGFDAGARSLPSVVPPDRRVRPGGELSPAGIEEIGESFLGPWAPRPIAGLPLGHGVSVAFADRWSTEDDRSIGALATLSHSSGVDNRTDAVRRVLSTAGADRPEVDYREQSTTRSIDLGGLATVDARPAPGHRLGLELVYNRLVDDEARILEGYTLDSDADQRNTRIRYLARSLLSAQLRGEHASKSSDGIRVDWRAGYARARRYEPNTREVLYRRASNGRFLFENFIQSGSIFHSEMTEDAWTGSADLRIPLDVGRRPVAIRTGVSATWRLRTTHTRRFRFVDPGTIPGTVRARSPNELFTTETVGPDGFRLREATFRPDNYDADAQVRAGYLTIEADPLARLRIVAGARVEQTIQRVDPRDVFPTPLPPIPGARLNAVDVLPAINLTGSPRSDMKIRLGLSRTLARPQLRELAPFSFADYIGGHLTVGNPALDRTRIDNIDLRWEWFPRAGSVVAVSGFHKRFHDPIEVVVFPSSERMKSWINAGGATNLGLELELRTSLGPVAAALDDFTLDANLTLVRSEVRMNDTVRVHLPGTGTIPIAGFQATRPLQGQAPYVANLGLTYANPETGMSATILYNRTGRRIDAVGGLVLPDIHEEPRQRLDLVVERPLPADLNLKIAAEQLLDGRVEFTQGDGIVRAYDRGRSVSISLGWNPGER